MQKKIYKVRSKVWLYPGVAGWHFLNVNEKVSKELREKYKKIRRGFGSLPVEVTIGPTSPRLRRASKTTWKTSIFPDKRSQTYLLPLKAKVRAAEGIAADDTITFSFRIR